MDVNSLSHSKWECKYHVVFAPKFRRKVIYGQLKPDIAEEPYEKYTENTIMTYEELIKELKMIQKRGYSIDDEENELEMLCCTNKRL